jgi:hypothetical protein
VCYSRKDAEFKLASDSSKAEDVFHYSLQRGKSVDENIGGGIPEKNTQNNVREQEKAFGTTSFAYGKNKFAVTKWNMTCHCDFSVSCLLFQ